MSDDRGINAGKHGARLPSGKLHPGLTNPEWLDRFKAHIQFAHNSERALMTELRIKPLHPSSLRACAAYAHLIQLRDFLIDSEDSAPPSECGRYGGPEAIHQAYQDACELFVKADRLLKAGKQVVFPIKTLAYIRALLEGTDPNAALDDADRLIAAVQPAKQRKEGGQSADAESRQQEGEKSTEVDAQRRVPSRTVKRLPPAREKAFSQRKWAIEQNAEFSDETTDHEVYKWLEEHLDEDKLPTFASWSRYLRDVRLAQGESKYSSRQGRTGRSIVSREDLD
jgi:hypothetical protein